MLILGNYGPSFDVRYEISKVGYANQGMMMAQSHPYDVLGLTMSILSHEAVVLTGFISFNPRVRARSKSHISHLT